MWRSSWGGRGRGGSPGADRGDDFFSGRFADGAGAIIDAALRERVAATACARFSVEAVECRRFLLRREFRHIHAGKLAGTVGMLQENLPSVLERFDFDAADRQTEQRATFGFVEYGISQAFMLLNDAAFGVDDERCGKRGDPAVLDAGLIGADGDGIVDAEGFDELLYVFGAFDVDGEADDLQLVLIFCLQLDEVGSFGAAGSAPGGPKIHENDFALKRGDRNWFSVERGQLEFRRGLGVAHETDDGGLIFLRYKKRSNAKK